MSFAPVVLPQAGQSAATALVQLVICAESVNLNEALSRVSY